MKKIFTLFASLILTVSVFAAARPKSTLTIQSAQPGDVRVLVDGRRFEPNDNYLRIQGLESGNHQVKIYLEKRNGSFTMFGRRYQVVYNSIINIRPRTSVTVLIDRFGRAMVNENRTSNGGYGRNDRDFNNRDFNDRDFNDRDFDDRNWDRNHDFDFGRGNNSGDYGNDRSGQWGGYDNHQGYESGMSTREFDQVMQSLEKEWLESNKLKSASHIVASNKLSAAQVRELMLLFSFESNKLDLAKQAYANTVDKRNFTVVNDAFSFNSSKDELARFIRNFR